MRIPRIFIDNALNIDQEIVFDHLPHHHLVHVLRRKSGSPLILFNGLGGEYHARLIHSSRTTSIARIQAYADCQRESKLRSILLQGISKGSRMDYTLQKASELGVSSIQPIVCERSTYVPHPSRINNKMQHWRGIIIAACEQSGRTIVPELKLPVSLQEGLKSQEIEKAAVLDAKATQGLSALGTEVRGLTLLVGPEGGFSEEELHLAEQQGYLRTRVGPRILRSETAGVVALSAAQMLWGDLR